MLTFIIGFIAAILFIKAVSTLFSDETSKWHTVDKDELKQINDNLLESCHHYTTGDNSKNDMLNLVKVAHNKIEMMINRDLEEELVKKVCDKIVNKLKKTK